jgi:hypothetical protein
MRSQVDESPPEDLQLRRDVVAALKMREEGCPFNSLGNLPRRIAGTAHRGNYANEISCSGSAVRTRISEELHSCLPGSNTPDASVEPRSTGRDAE